MNGRTGMSAFLGAVLLTGILAAPGSAQAQDSRWAAFLGCWMPAGGETDAGLLCFRPAGAGVEMFNVLGGQITAREQVVADGVARPVSAEGCIGTERVEFSGDGVRAFTHSEFQCAGEVRAGSGVMSFLDASRWIDVRSLTVGGEPVAWAQLYRAATAALIAEQGIEDPAAASQDLVRAARVRAGRPIEIADVEEVAARVDARATEVWVAAHETGFELSGSELVRLADAGVPEGVIDVVVAVSYPDRFVVSPEGSASEAELVAQAGGYPAGYRRGYGSYLFDPFRDPLGFRYGGLYSRYGSYGYGFGGYGGYWGYVPATIIVQPATPMEPEQRGRMVPGRGYTRDGSSSGGSSSGGARPPAASSGGGSSDGGSSSGGASGGSSSTGRTARPRN
jgi:hypothetical protein